MKIKLLKGGWIREKNNHPISFDNEGYLTDLITNEKGTLLLPNITITDKGIYRDIQERRLNLLREHSEIDPVTGQVKVIGAKSVYPEFDILTLFRGLPFIRPKSSLNKSNSSFNPSNFNEAYYYDNGLWNFNGIALDVKLGTEDAISFLKSLTYRDTLLHNKQVANRLGLDFITNPHAADRVAIKPQYDFKSISHPSIPEFGKVIYDLDPSRDIVKYNIYHNLRPTAFHESLHRGGYGTIPYNKVENNIPMFLYAKKLKDTLTFYDLKTKKLLKPRNSFTNLEDIMYWDYLTEKGEVPVNMLETGYLLKLPTGAEYPGDTKFNDVIRNTIIDKFFKTETLKDRKNVWKALTGRYFAVPMGVGVGITLFLRRNDLNTNNHTK